MTPNPFAQYKKIIRENVPLAMHTWLQLGGPAEYFAEPRNAQELVGLLQIARREELSVRVLGFGSNVLVSDDGVSGLVMRLTATEFGQIRSEKDRVIAGGGAKLGRIVTYSVHEGLAGLESLIGIPGTLGGGIQGNASSSNDDIGQWIEQVQGVSLSGEILDLSREDISFGYRQSTLENVIILSATLRLHEEDPFELSRRMQKLWIVRKTNQPIGHQCTGNVFRNPRGLIAGEVIEKAGLKGTRIGGAVISEQNAGFFIAETNCTCNDVLRLIHLVQSQVRERMDIDLELGIEIW